MTVSAKDLKVGNVIVTENLREYEVTRIKFSKSGKMIEVRFNDTYSEYINFGIEDYRANTKLIVK
jgi:hypothetical protein